MLDDDEIPCAASDPQTIGDEVISELLRLTDGWLHDQAASQTSPSSEFGSLLWQLLAAMQRDKTINPLQQKLPDALGSGFLLQSLFTRLFPAPPQPFAAPRAPNVIPRLTSREKEILLQVAQGYQRKEIAAHLGIKTGGIKSHLDNIFAKLGTDNSTEAVLKASAWGLIAFDLVTLIEPMVDSKRSSFNAIHQALLSDTNQGCREAAGDVMTQLGLLGLLLFLTTALFPQANNLQGEQTYARRRHGRIFEFAPDGNLLRTLDDGGQLCEPRGLAFAPLEARRHGFQPGNLYVINHRRHPDPLNSASILELTLQGEVVRSFTGGRFLSTRLYGPRFLTFTQDGRLMVGSGWNTDAVLEFTEGGNRVRRFAEIIPYGGMAADRNGNLYVVGGSGHRVLVNVFSLQGELLREIGENHTYKPPEERFYEDVAVSGNGDIYLANIRHGCIEVYDRDGSRIDCIGKGELKFPHGIALSSSGILFVLDGTPETLDIEVRGYHIGHHAWTTRFSAPAGVQFCHLTVAENGNLFLSGQQI